MKAVPSWVDTLFPIVAIRKNWCFHTVVLEKTLENPLDSKEFKPINPKGNQSWIFIGRTNTEAETPILWPPDVKSNSLEKALMLGKVGAKRWRGRQRMKWMDSFTNSVDMCLSKFWEIVKDREAWSAVVHGITRSQMQLSNWKTTSWLMWESFWRPEWQNLLWRKE